MEDPPQSAWRRGLRIKLPHSPDPGRLQDLSAVLAAESMSLVAIYGTKNRRKRQGVHTDRIEGQPRGVPVTAEIVSPFVLSSAHGKCDSAVAWLTESAFLPIDCLPPENRRGHAILELHITV